ncbi:MAG: PEGA domain-containing protein [Bdellovibrionota bacterium]
MNYQFRNAFAYFTLFCFLFMATGCATIVNGTKQKVKINSTPDGATVSVDGVDSGTTPATVKMRRKEDHKVVIKKPGYKPKEVELKNKMSWWWLGNVVIGGIIGLVVDMASGGVYKLEPKKIDAALEPEQPPPAAEAPASQETVAN